MSQYKPTPDEGVIDAPSKMMREELVKLTEQLAEEMALEVKRKLATIGVNIANNLHEAMQIRCTPFAVVIIIPKVKQ